MTLPSFDDGRRDYDALVRDVASRVDLEAGLAAIVDDSRATADDPAALARLEADMRAILDLDQGLAQITRSRRRATHDDDGVGRTPQVEGAADSHDRSVEPLGSTDTTTDGGAPSWTTLLRPG